VLFDSPPMKSGDKVNGIIISRTGETLIVSNREGKTTVVVTDDTTTKDDRGTPKADTDAAKNNAVRLATIIFGCTAVCLSLTS
jgi:hypothetical protein